MSIDGQTQIVGIIGWPVAHSLSPLMHNAAFAHLNMNWRYVPFPVRDADLRTALAGLHALGVRGVNVTVPHKVSVISQVDSVTDAVQIVGAVNTIRVDRETGKLEGLNTDLSGFLADLAVNDITVDSKSQVIILGAGGAARAVATGLIRFGARVTIINRTPEKANSLIEFARIGWPQAKIAVAGYDDLPKLAKTATLIVNCTPVGMWPHIHESPWPDGLPFPDQATLYDTVYRPLRTLLVEQAAATGARAMGGLGMLVYQGATAFEAWTGRKPPIEVMRLVCQDALSAVPNSTELTG
jgi:shikimate dehydrogenase